MRIALLCLICAASAAAEIHHNPGSTAALPHEKYIHVVSEADSPVQQTYIKSKEVCTSRPRFASPAIPR